MATENKFLGTLGTKQLIASIRAEDATNLEAAKKYAADTAQTKVNELANGQVKTNTGYIGTMSNLATAAKADLVSAINEVRNAVSSGETASAVTLTTNSTPNTGMSKTYTLKQGSNTIGSIDIPKDMVVQSGSVVVNPAGQTAGTYIKLVLANAANDEIYVNVGSLVDVYTAKANATQIQLTIDSTTRAISAAIVDGAVGVLQLATSAVVTAKIADGNVTKAKLASNVQASLDKADVAESNAKNYTDGRESQIRTDLTAVTDALEARITEAVGTNHTHANATVLEGISAAKVSAWDSAEQNAKNYADDLNDDMDARVQALEDVTYVEFTAAEISAMFQ